MSIVERFIRYAKIGTQSSQDSDTFPTTAKQLDLARVLVEECREIGLTEVELDEFGIVYATLEGNVENVPVIGFLAHMDTASDASGDNVQPRIVEKYDGGNIFLGTDKVLSPDKFANLSKYIGQDIIVTNGSTLLGADDKAGIASILTAMEFLIHNPEIKRGKIRIAFTPDEEVGKGTVHFDVEKFAAQFAYTVDGGEIGELEYETFNAATAKFVVNGTSVHTGSAKNIMINSILIAAEIIEALPKNMTPAATENREGFYHVGRLNGSVVKTEFNVLIRDFEKKDFTHKKNFIIDLCESLNKKYGKNTVILNIVDTYYNMAEKIKDRFFIVEIAKEAMRDIGLEPVIKPVRGGTDGARLSFMGLPCPNLFTGGANYHGPFEYLPVESLKKSAELVVKICENVGKGRR